MVTVIRRSVIAVVLNLSVLAVAHAGWSCYMHDARGMRFAGEGYNRSAASAHVMNQCVRNSTWAKNCVLEFCRKN